MARSSSPEPQVQYTPSKSSGDSGPKHDSLATTDSLVTAVDEDDSFDLPLSNEEELIVTTDSVIRQMTMAPPETPRKAQKTDLFSTPGSKRRFSEMDSSSSAPAPNGNWSTPTSADDVFITPKTSSKPLYPRLQLPSPFETPTPNRFKDPPVPFSLNPQDGEDMTAPQPAGQDTASLSNQVFALLFSAHITLTDPTKQSLQDLLSRHDLRTQGIIKGREISRLALKDKNLKIAELQGRIGELEGERETNRNVIACLKSDMKASVSNRGRGRGRGRGRRS